MSLQKSSRCILQYQPTGPKQNVTQGQFLSRVKLVLIKVLILLDWLPDPG